MSETQIHERIAADIAPLGGVLRCEKCRNEFPLAKGRVGGFLANGWPKCCGETMRWITAKELGHVG